MQLEECLARLVWKFERDAEAAKKAATELLLSGIYDPQRSANINPHFDAGMSHAYLSGARALNSIIEKYFPSASLQDEQWAKRIIAECGAGDPTRDQQIDHGRADDILCELLKSLGYTETVEAFERVGKWYA